MTAMSGLPAYLDLAEAAGLGESVRRHVGMREGGQGWTDAQMVTSLVMLNLAGGESVVDVRVLEKDEGLGRVLLRAETHRMRRGERSAPAQEMAQAEEPHHTVGNGGVQIPRQFPPRLGGGQKAAAHSVHTRGPMMRWADFGGSMRTSSGSCSTIRDKPRRRWIWTRR